ncbi:hypothetical protein NE237_018871 [Protea cynaroides]|uniref:Uncharacterized protein n=1 Tax=Protea cynaroides TaxID=273540 RepID=A0A9Q0KAQ6_9MAGN|nr:hypothetical protein NE237_018871 [Protea cynaroides]
MRMKTGDLLCKRVRTHDSEMSNVEDDKSLEFTDYEEVEMSDANLARLALLWSTSLACSTLFLSLNNSKIRSPRELEAPDPLIGIQEKKTAMTSNLVSLIWMFGWFMDLCSNCRTFRSYLKFLWF